MRSKISKIMSLILIAAMIVTCANGYSGVTRVWADENMLISAAPETANVYVNITDDNGKLVVRQQSVEVTDVDGDGLLTVSDALYAAHEKYYTGGAEAGYAFEDAANYGLTGYSLKKIWGIENGGSYGIYVNDAPALSAQDTVAEGDYVSAFCYTDLQNYSDTYSYFNKRIIEIQRGESVTLKLYNLGYDENWEIKKEVVKKAPILDNNKETEYVTNKKGKVTITFEKIGSHLITAASPKGKNLVTPTCIVSVLPNKGNIVTIDGIKYSVVKAGSLINNKKGKVTCDVSKVEEGKKIPKTIKIGGITYKVTKVEE